MKTKQLTACAVAALSVAIVGCSKENHPAGAPNANPVRAIIDQNRSTANQSYIIDAAQGGTVFGAEGTIITIEPNAFRTNSGGMVSGPVTVELLEALEPADMVWLNMQTVALYGNDKRMLQSGGEMRLRAEAAGQQVTVAPGAAVIHVPVVDIDPLMQRFVGEEDGDGDILWRADGELDADTGGFAIQDSMGGGGWVQGNFYSAPWPANTYNTTWPDYGYINCDHPLPPGGDSTDVTITVPQGFTGWNGCTVWIVLPDLNCMVYMEVYNGNNISAGFPLRVGLQGTIVAFSEQNGSYHSSFTPITIVQGHQQTITLDPTTLAQYEQDLQGL